MTIDTAVGEGTSHSDRKHRAGQRLLVGLAGPQISAEERDYYQRIDPAGYILPATLLSDPKLTKALIAELTRLSKSRTPPHFAVDGEGGRVWRLASKWPTPQQVSKHPTLMRPIFDAMADEIASLGLTLNLAPVVERYTPMLGDRVAGNDTFLVFIDSMKRARIGTTAKHFPGHSDQSTDPHNESVIVVDDEPSIFRTMLPPFKRAITAGVDTIMVSHAIFPSLDPFLPASISPHVVPRWLRQRLGYQGVAMTDDLCMAAVECAATIDSAVAGATSGEIDLMMVVHGVERQMMAFEALVHQSEQQPQLTIPAYQRLNALKLATFINRPPSPPTKVIGCLAHRQLAEQVWTSGTSS